MEEELEDKRVKDEFMDRVQHARQEAREQLLKKIDTLTSQARNTPTDNLINQARRDAIKEFFASIPSQKCANCGAFSARLRKDGATKIFQLPLSDRAQKGMRALGIIGDDDETGKTGRDVDSDAESEDELIGSSGKKRAMDMDDSKEGPKFLPPTEVERHMKNLWDKEQEIVTLIWNAPSKTTKRKVTPDMFFLHVLAVPPSRFRPESKLGEETFVHQQTATFIRILNCNAKMKEMFHVTVGEEDEYEADLSKVVSTWVELQDSVNILMDNSKATRLADKEGAGIRQLLERKQGMFRMKMMGKRVNYAARSVISPDPYIDTNEIGIPAFAAKKLTYPEPVTPWNVKMLRDMVVNGPDQHPGANSIEDENGNVIVLSNRTYEQRVALSKTLLTGASGASSGNTLGVVRRRGKVVYRQLISGDVLLVNRQPTLHKPGIMAHIARVLPQEQTIRMHYANCNTYNADFDGDEMNLHFPQNEIARAEAYYIANTDNQYVVPTSGKPLRGLIQDHVISGALLTCRDTFFDRDEYWQLLYGACYHLVNRRKIDAVLTLPPAIWKPKPLWTGKQVISTILHILVGQHTGAPSNQRSHGAGGSIGGGINIGLNLDGSTKVPAEAWGATGVEEAQVVIRDNELICGILDKNQFGATEFGMVHAFNELYGAQMAGQLLTCLGRLFTMYLQFRGFTCGMDDLLLTPEAEKKRSGLLRLVLSEGLTAAAKFAGLEDFKNYGEVHSHSSQGEGREMTEKEREKEKRRLIRAMEKKLRSERGSAAQLDSLMSQYTSPVTSKIIGSCIPGGQYKPFPENCFSGMVLTGAKGSAVNHAQISALLKQTELEGRRVPVMPSGKTLPCYVPFDPSPRAGGYITDRFLTGVKPQDFFFHCMAGREGLVDTAVKTSRSGYLQRCLVKHLESLRVHYDGTVRDDTGSIIQFYYGEDSVDIMKSKFLDKFTFLAKNYAALIHKYNPAGMASAVNGSDVKKYQKRCMKEPIPDRHRSHDPVMAKFSPARYLGAISEKLAFDLDQYIRVNPDNVLLSTGEDNGENGSKKVKVTSAEIKPRHFKTLLHLKAMHSLVDPGEPVGVLAAQSVGEPSTQMTLNTFHLAGHGGANVTLGIPRLREIIMTASRKIKTPAMVLPLLPGLPAADAEDLSRKFQRLRLSELIKEITVLETVTLRADGVSRVRSYEICLKFESIKAIRTAFHVDFTNIKQVIQTQFVNRLVTAVMRYLKKGGGKKEENEQDIGATAADKPRKNKNNAGGEPEDVEKLGDTAAEKIGEDDILGEEEGNSAEIQMRKKKQMASYDDPDDEEMAEVNNEEEDEQEDEPDQSADSAKAKSKTGKSKSNGSTSNGNEDDEEEEGDDMDIETKTVLTGPAANYIKEVRFDRRANQAVVLLQVAADARKLLLVSMIEKVATQVLIRSIQGIDKCFVIQQKKKDRTEETCISTEGVNFNAAWQHADRIDVNRIQCNDIGAIMDTFGVEAGRGAIVSEVNRVFGAYGIAVDPRHLGVIADYMTFGGGYKALNRQGMSESCSPFLKMSFETTMNFLTDATVFGETDRLKSPASRIVMGQVVDVGTGTFEILQPLVKTRAT
eukprot:GILK01005496.1.p1 GENE.GILK01005496.1~~GILK01005496.1.p1  ORF type:complete len:1772 (-),score=385.89 GILK01005496.1:91-4842(-)